jgi:hypothetical protein
MLRQGAICAFALLAAILLPLSVAAQESVTLETSVLFYGDNTEFSNPFREGETLFGAAIRLFADVRIGERVALNLGAVGNHRFGADDAFEFVKPIASLAVQSKSGASRFVMGSLETTNAWRPAGPDRGGPHGLLPPLQRETLAFERPYDAGLQWFYRSPRIDHESWINWQQVNTPEHRERFDIGIDSLVTVRPPLSLAFQAHVVHRGGQLFASGPVADSFAYGPGLMVRHRTSRFGEVGFEAFGLVSHFVPDREAEHLNRDGAGMFLRLQARRDDWRGHLIVWRGDDFLKEEGDANYLAVRMDGRRWRGVRDYSEIGLTRFLRPAPGVALEISARLHRIEPDHYEYSYRILAAADLGWRVR